MTLRKCIVTPPGQPTLHVDMTAPEEVAFLAQRARNASDPKQALRLKARKLSGQEESIYTNLIAANVMAKTDLPAETMEALNARRALRNKPPL